MKPIEIWYYSEVIDSFGRVEASTKGEIIFAVLNNVDDWNDEMIFESTSGEVYSIDGLAGKQVSVSGIGIFTVPEDNN